MALGSTLDTCPGCPSFPYFDGIIHGKGSSRGHIFPWHQPIIPVGGHGYQPTHAGQRVHTGTGRIGVTDAGGGFCDHAAADFAVWGDEFSRSIAFGAGIGCGAGGRQPVGGERTGFQRYFCQQAAGTSRRAGPVHTLVLGGFLGCPRNHDGRCGSNRSGAGTGGDLMGSKRHERRDQCGHQKLRGYPRPVGLGGRRQPGTGICQRALRRNGWEQPFLPGVWHL